MWGFRKVLETIHSFKHPLTILEHISHQQGGLMNSSLRTVLSPSTHFTNTHWVMKSWMSERWTDDDTASGAGDLRKQKSCQLLQLPSFLTVIPQNVMVLGCTAPLYRRLSLFLHLWLPFSSSLSPCSARQRSQIPLKEPTWGSSKHLHI